MALSYPSLIQQTVSSGGSGSVTLGSATSGKRALGAGNDGQLVPYKFTDGTAWEYGIGTYTNSGTSLARTLRISSSTGSALTLTTSAIFEVDLSGEAALTFDVAGQGVLPGGRLTLTSGLPVTTGDVSGATNIYYTPFLSNVISVWDGYRWTPVTFSELTLAIGTVTNGGGYDVFGYLSSGTLAVEKLIWSNPTTRATAVTIQDGRYCKSGDKTRLYLGSFCASSTTTTADTVSQRFLWNRYNRVKRSMLAIDATSAWAYNSATVRQANGNSANKVEFFCGFQTEPVIARIFAAIFDGNDTSYQYATTGIGIDSTTTYASGQGCVSPSYYPPAEIAHSMHSSYDGYPGLGYHYLSWNETGSSGISSFFGTQGGVQSALTAEVFA